MSAPNELRPFSNGSEGADWHHRNCGRCTKRGEPDAQGNGPCAIETAVAKGFILGTIPREVAERAGASISEQVSDGVGFCRMPRWCAEFDVVMVCEAKRDLRRRYSPKCGEPATSKIEAQGGTRPVCAKHRRRYERAFGPTTPSSQETRKENRE